MGTKLMLLRGCNPSLAIYLLLLWRTFRHFIRFGVCDCVAGWSSLISQTALINAISACSRVRACISARIYLVAWMYTTVCIRLENILEKEHLKWISDSRPSTNKFNQTSETAQDFYLYQHHTHYTYIMEDKHWDTDALKRDWLENYTHKCWHHRCM